MIASIKRSCSLGSSSNRLCPIPFRPVAWSSKPKALHNSSHLNGPGTSQLVGCSSSRNDISSRSVACYSRPQWARGNPSDDFSSSGSGLSTLVTTEVVQCSSLPELETVFLEHGSSFSHVNAAAALVKFAKLQGKMSSKFFSKLGASWLGQLPLAGPRECANVLWACSRMGSAAHPVWDATWQAFTAFVDKDLGSSYVSNVQPQGISNTLYACAKLRKQPAADDVQLLIEAFLQPTILSKAAPQAIANVTWSLGLLGTLPGWEANISQEMLQQLFAEEQLERMLAEGSSQHISNMFVALGRMCTAPRAMLSAPAAQGYAKQLLASVPLGSIPRWQPQHISNTLWALGELQLFDEQFIGAAVAAAPAWLPNSTGYDITQAATACAQLQYRNEQFMQDLVTQGQELLKPSQPGALSPKQRLLGSNRASLAALSCISVVQLDMQGIAGAARQLVESSGVSGDPKTHPSNLRRLWVFHTWLKHQLLDGKGLSGLLTEQQLQRGEREAATWGSKSRL